MKHIQLRRKLTGQIIHVRRSMWGQGILPSMALRVFKELRAEGWYHLDYTWAMLCKSYRKKIRKMKIAKLSRKGSKKRIKRAR